MISTRYILLLLAFVFTETWLLPAQPTKSDSEKSGEELVAELRALQPAESSEITGKLIIKRDKQTEEISVVCRVLLKENHWETIYETKASSRSGAEKLIIKRFENKPNQYFYTSAIKPGEPLGEPKLLAPSNAAIPFANSDFWLTDLGLDFLHWPEQTRLPGEMRLGQPCYVIESRNPQFGEIVRVKSWIDKESGGILVAEAYDKNRKLIKEFSLSGSSFKKVNGRWQLEEMTIRNLPARSKTTLKLDLSEP